MVLGAGGHSAFQLVFHAFHDVNVDQILTFDHMEVLDHVLDSVDIK